MCSEWPRWRVFENVNVAGNRVPEIPLESLCVLFSEEICGFSTLIVLKLVICSIFIGKEGRCVIFYLPLSALNIQDTLPISHAMHCLLLTCLRKPRECSIRAFLFSGTTLRILSAKLPRNGSSQTDQSFHFVHFNHCPALPTH